MKDQLVTLEIAKLAKEKGFNEPCLYHWELGSGDIDKGCAEGVFTSGSELVYSELLTTYFHKGIQCGEWSAPTQSLLQRWLREKHGIHITVYVDRFNSYHWEIDIYKQAGDGGEGLSHDILFFQHEDALEAALKEALNLIK